MKKLLLQIALLIGVVISANAQTWPTPHNLAQGNFSFTEIQPGAGFPAGMDIYSPAFPLDTAGWFTTEPNAPNVDAAFNWTCASATQRSRFKFLGTNGLSFANTGQPQWDNCQSGTTANNLRCGIALISLNTTGVSGSTISWTNTLIAQGDGNGGSAGTTTPRVYAIIAQTRIGNTGPWTDIPNGEFSSLNLANGDSARFSFNVPSQLLNLPEVQVRWFYYQKVRNLRGTRPEISLDNILITNTASGISSLEQKGFRFYPNPAKGFAGVESGIESCKIFVFNNLGQQVKSAVLEKGYNQITLQTAGIYRLVVSSANGQTLGSRTIVVE